MQNLVLKRSPSYNFTPRLSIRRGLFISRTLVLRARLANLKPKFTNALLIAISNRLFTSIAFRAIMFNDASGLDAMPFRDIEPDPVMNWGMDVPASPSIAMFPIARDCATFNNDMSLDLRLRGALRPPRRLAIDDSNQNLVFHL